MRYALDFQCASGFRSRCEPGGSGMTASAPAILDWPAKMKMSRGVRAATGSAPKMGRMRSRNAVARLNGVISVIVRPEGRHGQAMLAGEIANGIVGPAVTDGDRFLDVVTGQFHFVISFYCSFGPMPDFVLGANGETERFVYIKGSQPVAKAIELDREFVPGNFHAFEFRAAIRQLHPVILHQRPSNQARGNVVLVPRMNVLALAQINDDGLPGVREFHGHRLRFAQFRPTAVTRLLLLSHEIGELHPIEWEIALSPFLAPLLDHEGKEIAIFPRAAG